MTILVSSVFPNVIIMLSDSTVTTTFSSEEEKVSYNEYETAKKYFVIPGVGYITTWGERTYNKLGQYLHKQNISPEKHSVHDLANLTYKYICDEYSKETDLGFHIGGFDRPTGKPYLYHVFWGFDRPRPEDQKAPLAHKYDHSNWIFLYNGRNDLAHAIITTLREQIETGQEIKFDLGIPLGRILLCDFIARFVAEITPTVGPPFTINLIFPDNTMEKVENTSFSPIPPEQIDSAIQKLPSISDFPQSNENTVLGTLPITPSGGGMPPTGTPNEEIDTAGTAIFTLRRKKNRP